MSLLNQGKPARIKSVAGNNTGTAAEDVYTCPANCRADISFIHVLNVGATNTITLDWLQATGSVSTKILSAKSFATGAFEQFADLRVILTAGDKIRITPGSSGDVETIVTVTETFNPVG
tara:strand:+ start:422 stop:778 length:357 start_codon:yes stop_codon:yes gene_type:complete